MRFLLLIAALAAADAPPGAELPKVLFFANPMSSDNDVIRRTRPDVLSVAERHFAALSKGVFDVTITQDGAQVIPENLARYRGVVFFTAINPPGVDKDGLIAWVHNGGAFVGIHSTANTFQNHPAFGAMLGARFDRRPWRTRADPQTQVRILVEDGTHPATRHLEKSFAFADDIYQFKDFDRDKVDLLLRLDPASLDLANPKVNHQDKVFPVSWAKGHGKGRVFYTALGDWDQTWSDPRYRTHLIEGIRWTMRLDAGTAAAAAAPAASNATVPGAVTTPYPTIVNLAIEWKIEGDDNLDGVVSVRYRAVGEDAWREAMPLRRVPAGQSRGTRPIFRWDNKHSGSIFDLKPKTEYEVALALRDPDGGSAEQVVRARTRAVPRPAAGAPARTVDKGEIRSARPGEILVLAPGDYGEFVVPRDGEPDRPIVYRSPDGSAVFSSISLRNRKFIHLDGLTVKNEQPRGTGINMAGAERCAVRYCTVNATYGIRASAAPGAKECYIADNVLRGVSPWRSEAMGANGDNIGEGIQMTGPANVIAFNRVTGFRDCISTMEEQSVTDQFCIDIYHNEIDTGADDGIEADFCFHNCRIVRNRLTNCFVGLSSQPGLGGPTYFVRNAMYNLVFDPFKLNRGSQGDVMLHNTAVKVGDGLRISTPQPFDHALARNNLCIGGPPGDVRWGGYGAGRGYAAWVNAPGPHSSFDYDAIGTFETPFAGSYGKQRFSSLDELRRGPHERHGVKVDLGVFRELAFPLPPVPERKAQDLRPREGTPVVDAGVRLPNINDDFRGAGPDIGAYEAGQPLPRYGPRPRGVDEETAAGR